MKYSQIEDLRNQIVEGIKNYIVTSEVKTFINQEFNGLFSRNKLTTCKITEVIDNNHIKISINKEKPLTETLKYFNSCSMGTLESFVKNCIVHDHCTHELIKNWRTAVQSFFEEQPSRTLSKDYILQDGLNQLCVGYITPLGPTNYDIIRPWCVLSCEQLEQLLKNYMYDYYAMKE